MLKQLLKEGVAKPEWQPTPQNTYCNLFVDWVCQQYGYFQFKDLLASEILKVAQLPTSPWKALPEASYADLAAFPLTGRLVLYASAPPPGSEHGHVCIGAPEWEMEWSPKWGVFLPKVASVGRTNGYGLKLSYVFTAKPEVFILEEGAALQGGSG